ncbi:flagellar hook-length control protein FliK [Marinitoga lauensis]|uniref:flagellar hook-length control protein FliK n=1 Tax=Marinitoga lauensis TaxID=2201189 RepID=UPI001012D9AB|nr:flagellar hook-length control protein FliK [Marinitoga lauensis]
MNIIKKDIFLTKHNKVVEKGKIIISKNIGKDIIKIKFKTGIIAYINNDKKTKFKLFKLNKEIKDRSNINLITKDIKTIFENKIRNFERSNNQSKLLYSDKKVDLIISKKISNNQLKEKAVHLSKNIMSNTQKIKKMITKNTFIILNKKDSQVNVGKVFKYVDSIVYKINKNNQIKNKDFLVNKNQEVFTKKSAKKIISNNIYFLHPTIKPSNTNFKEIYETKQISANELLNRIYETTEKIQNIPKYFERTVVKINPPDLGNLEITIVKSQKNLKIEFNLENSKNKEEIERRMEPLIVNLKEKYEKVEIAIKTEFNDSNENYHEDEKNQENESEYSKENTSKEKEKRKNKRNQFWELLRGEEYD